MAYDIVKSLWFDSVGIVCVRTSRGEYVYYIGSVGLVDPISDAEYIADHGTLISPDKIVEFLTNV